MEKLIRTDKNGTKYYEVTEKCMKCQGTGFIKYYWQHYDGICFDCKGKGYKTYKKKVYLPEYEAKLEANRKAKRIAKAPEVNQKFFKENGLNEEGKTYVVLGKTYEIKEELKAKGARFSKNLLWHFGQKVEGYNLLEVTADDYGTKNAYGEYEYDGAKIQRLQYKMKGMSR